MGKPQQALEELRRVIRQKPDATLAHNALGLALEDEGNLDAAVESFRAAVSLDPTFALGYYNLAYALSEQKRFKAAVYYLEKAVSLQPQEFQYQIPGWRLRTAKWKNSSKPRICFRS